MQTSGSNGSDDWPPHAPVDRLSAARGVVASAVERRARGENVPDQQIIDSHPDLMPELARELMLRRVVRRAYVAARKAGPARPSNAPLEPFTSTEIDRPIDAEPDAAGNVADVEALPDLFGYELQDAIGAGGQASVFRGVQESTGRRVAVKILAGGAFAPSRERARFEREAKVLASLEHPGLVSILDRGRTGDGGFYMVMPYVEGCDLDEYLDAEAGEAPASLADLLRLFVKIADAVGEAHRNGIVHRDLKPSNVRIDPRGEPHVLDFGLARLLDDDAPAPDDPVTAVTRKGQVVGSMPWFSPEQAAGTPAAVDARTDVYALGVMLYDAATGRLPYEPAPTWQETKDRITKAIPLPPSRVAGARYAPIPVALDAVLMKALAKRPGDRYVTAAELARDLENVLRGQRTVARRFARRRRWWRVAAVGAVSVCLAGGLVWKFRSHRSPRTKEVAVSPSSSLERFTNSIGMEFVRLPAGTAVVPLGRGPSASEYDIDVDRPFAISPRPVTRGQFATVMRLPRPATIDIGRQVAEVTSREAREFCRLLGELEGREVRVPTYADLAYAAAAGTRYVEEATFDSIDPAASNAWGIYGLRGNLAEWCVSSRGSSAPGSATAPSDTGLELFHSPYTLRTDQDHQALPSSERHAFRVILPERR